MIKNNIFDECTYCRLYLNKFNEKDKQAFIDYCEKEGYSIIEDDDNPYIDDLLLSEIYYIYEYNNINLFDYIDYAECDYREDVLESILRDYLGTHNHYLVVASNCTWDGASGYKFCNDILSTVYRDYETSLYIDEFGKDCIKCTEHSHDVPMGHTTIIVGLTNEEFEQLEEADFDEIEKFAMSKF